MNTNEVISPSCYCDKCNSIRCKEKELARRGHITKLENEYFVELTYGNGFNKETKVLEDTFTTWNQAYDYAARNTQGFAPITGYKPPADYSITSFPINSIEDVL